MESTSNLNLKKTTLSTWVEDNPKDTIIEYGENFEKIDLFIAESTGNPEDLVVGKTYYYATRIWDNSPSLGEYIGFVNLREGLYAPKWTPLKNYVIGDYVRAVVDNGNVYQCVVDGRSMNTVPTFLTNTNVEFHDAIGNQWIPNYNYEVDDIVFSTDGSKLFYYICETSGLSDVVEPEWANVIEGTILIDGSVVWRKEKTVIWKQVGASSNFRPFGKIE